MWTVTNVSPGREMFLNIQVIPAADLSRLEEVLVVTEKQEQNAVVENGGRVRAADILAQRLPSVPDKPAADAAAAVPGTTPAGGTKVVSPGQSPNASPKLQTPAAGSPKPATVEHAAATPSTVKVAGGASAGTASVGGTAVSASGAKAVPGGGPAGVQVPKKVVPKAAAGDSTPNGSSGTSAASDAANPTAKPATAQTKPPVSQPAPQPPTTEDDPH